MCLAALSHGVLLSIYLLVTAHIIAGFSENDSPKIKSFRLLFSAFFSLKFRICIFFFSVFLYKKYLPKSATRFQGTHTFKSTRHRQLLRLLKPISDRVGTVAVGVDEDTSAAGTQLF